MTRHEIIHKVATAIDPMAFTPEADPHRFANAIIAAENAIWEMAECDLEEVMINAGWEDDHGTPDFERDFRALLRSIVEGKSADAASSMEKERAE